MLTIRSLADEAVFRFTKKKCYITDMGGQSPISSREVKKFETNQQCSVLTVEFISTVVLLLVSVFKVSSTNFANM